MSRKATDEICRGDASIREKDYALFRLCKVCWCSRPSSGNQTTNGRPKRHKHMLKEEAAARDEVVGKRGE